ncbi:hypothetical protein FNF31_00537 [Cafeteria roenbergensis]|uniref:UBC core domain-containing protein n=1 Tax=Cafeteria roenbergensis TaxID=33653 RepID=A0A5A8D1Q3_CAFRO|nr:hypothetical protein FNF28_06467 [Cafeteria roenbergensis]KAA0168038.1 hypothetical protein FNF31_00537 [Cafeteria roenbergensis]
MGSTVQAFAAEVARRAAQQLRLPGGLGCTLRIDGGLACETDTLADLVDVGLAQTPIVAVMGAAASPDTCRGAAPCSADPPQPPGGEPTVLVQCAFAGSARVAQVRVPRSATVQRLKRELAKAMGFAYVPDSGRPDLVLPPAPGEDVGVSLFLVKIDGAKVKLTVPLSAKPVELFEAAAKVMDVAPTAFSIRHKDASIARGESRTLRALGIAASDTVAAARVVGMSAPPVRNADTDPSGMRISIDLFTATAPLHSTEALDKSTLVECGLAALAREGRLDLFAVARATNSPAFAGDSRADDAESGDVNFHTGTPGWMPLEIDRPLERRRPAAAALRGAAAAAGAAEPEPEPALAKDLTVHLSTGARADLGATLRTIASADAVPDAAFAGLLARLRMTSGFSPACLALARLREQLPVSEAERCAIATALWTAGRVVGVVDPLERPRAVLWHLLGRPSVCVVGTSTVAEAGLDDSVAAGDPGQRRANDPAAVVLLPPSATDGGDAYRRVQLTCASGNADDHERMDDPVRVDLDAMPGVPGVTAGARAFFKSRVFSRKHALKLMPGGENHDAGSAWRCARLGMLKPDLTVATLLRGTPPAAGSTVFAWMPPAMSAAQLESLQAAQTRARTGAAASGAGARLSTCTGEPVLHSSDDRALVCAHQLSAGVLTACGDFHQGVGYAFGPAFAAAAATLQSPRQEDSEVLEAAMYASKAASSMRLHAIAPHSLARAPNPSLTFCAAGHMAAFLGFQECSTNVLIYDAVAGKTTPEGHAELGARVKALPLVKAELDRIEVRSSVADRDIKELCAVLLDRSQSMCDRGFPEEEDPVGAADRRRASELADARIQGATAVLRHCMTSARASIARAASEELSDNLAAPLAAARLLRISETGRAWSGTTIASVAIPAERAESQAARDANKRFDDQAKVLLCKHEDLNMLRLVFRQLLLQRDTASGRANIQAFLGEVLPYALMDEHERLNLRPRFLHLFKSSIGRWVHFAVAVLCADPAGIFTLSRSAQGSGGSSAAAAASAPKPDITGLQAERAFELRGKDCDAVSAFLQARSAIGRGAPASLKCPISGELMTMPVKWAGDGRTYQRQAIHKHVHGSAASALRSPATHAAVPADKARSFTVDEEALAGLKRFLESNPHGCSPRIPSAPGGFAMVPIRVWPSEGDKQHKCQLLWVPNSTSVFAATLLHWTQAGFAGDKMPSRSSMWYNISDIGDGWLRGTLASPSWTVLRAMSSLAAHLQPAGSFAELDEPGCNWGSEHGRSQGPHGVLIQDEHFTPHDAPDRTPRLLTVKELFHAFTNRLVAYDSPIELSLTAFGTSVEETCAFTPLFEEFRSKVDEVAWGGDTALLDGISESITRLVARRNDKHAEAKPNLRILVLSDGRDTCSKRSTALDVAKALQKESVTLDAVAIGAESNDDLFALCKCSGGLFFHPESLEESQRLVELEVFLTTIPRESPPTPPRVTTQASLEQFKPGHAYERDSALEGRLPAMRHHPLLSEASTGVDAAVELTAAAEAAAETVAATMDVMQGKASQLVLDAAMAAAAEASFTAFKDKSDGDRRKAAIRAVATQACAGARAMQRLRRLQADLKKIKQRPHPFVEVFPSATDPGFWKLLVRGPEGSPYASGIWLAYFVMPDDFPRRPPAVTFKTPIKHMNVSPAGRVCHSVLASGWSADIPLRTLLDAVYGMLLTPEMDTPVDTVLATQYNRDRVGFTALVYDHTVKFAQERSLGDWRKHLQGDG